MRYSVSVGAYKPKEHSENKIITKHVNEVGPEVLQFSIQQALICNIPDNKNRIETYQ